MIFLKSIPCHNNGTIKNIFGEIAFNRIENTFQGGYSNLNTKYTKTHSS